MLNARQFPVVAQTYFGVKQRCLEGLVGQSIRQKSGGNRPNIQTTCDAYGENLVKSTLLELRWTYHHDAINLYIHKIARQSDMSNDMEIED